MNAPLRNAIKLIQLSFLIALPLSLQAQTTAAPNAADLKVLTGTCFSCHGEPGHTPAGMPDLRGQSAQRLQQRMLDFKNGKAPDTTVMHWIMSGYEAAEIAALTQWFSQAQKAAP